MVEQSPELPGRQPPGPGKPWFPAIHLSGSYTNHPQSYKRTINGFAHDFPTLLANKDTILADPTLSDAWQIAARRHAEGVLLAAPPDTLTNAVSANLIPDPGFEKAATAHGPSGLTRRMSRKRSP